MRKQFSMNEWLLSNFIVHLLFMGYISYFCSICIIELLKWYVPRLDVYKEWFGKDYFDVILLYFEWFYFRFKPQKKIDEVVSSFEIEKLKGL